MQIDGQNVHCNGEEAESSGTQEELLALEREEKANQLMTEGQCVPGDRKGMRAHTGREGECDGKTQNKAKDKIR